MEGGANRDDAHLSPWIQQNEVWKAVIVETRVEAAVTGEAPSVEPEPVPEPVPVAAGVDVYPTPRTCDDRTVQRA